VTTVRSINGWLAVSWAVVVLSLLTVRWLDIAALSRVLSVRVVVLFTILLIVVSMARDQLFRQLVLLSLAACLLASTAVVVWWDLPFSDREFLMELVVPSTGYAVLGLFAARVAGSFLGERIGHPYHCECGSLDPPV